MKRVLYATNHHKTRYEQLHMLVSLAKTGMQECVLVNSAERIIPEQYFQEWRWHLSAQGVDVEVSGGGENPVDLVLESAGEKSFSLVVVDFEQSESKGAFRSIVRPLIKWLSVPLLIIGGGDDAGKESGIGVLQDVVFVTDLSSSADRAASFLLSLHLTKRVKVVNVVPQKIPVGQSEVLEERLQQTAKVFSSSGIEGEIHICVGRTVEEILRAKERYNASAIVMVVGRKRFLKEAFCESPACRVAKELPCPVLLVP
ncbi:MAG: universal stress protein [Pseudomonadota bacterium]